MRSRVRLLVVGVLVLVLAAGAALLGRDLWEQKKQDLALQVLDILPDVAQRIRNFNRVKVEDGRKVWEVSAREAQYFEEEGVVSVEEPKVELFFEDERHVAFSGRTGRVLLAGKNLSGVELRDEIVVDFDGYELETDFARYVVDDEKIFAPDAVTIRGEGFELNGAEMEVDLKTRRLEVRRDVRMELWPKS
jgi:LPS export ABC transporter protein LptC